MYNDLTAIGRYVSDREKCLAEVMVHHKMSRDAAKDLFRKLLCQGSYDYDRAQGPCKILNQFWDDARERRPGGLGDAGAESTQRNMLTRR